MKNHNGHGIKLIIIISATVAVLILGLGFIKSRMGGFSAGSQMNGGDLVIVNNTSETASSAFTRDGKIVAKVVKPGEKTSGGRGLIRMFIAKKNGAYEIQYPFPRPVGKPTEISLTEIISAAHTPQMGQELYTEKGMIQDIKVDYEEVRDLEVTY